MNRRADLVIPPTHLVIPNEERNLDLYRRLLQMSRSTIGKSLFAVTALTLLAATTLFAWQSPPPADLKASMTRGKVIYDGQCVTCHRPKGDGIKDVYPPLAKSDYLAANKARAIATVANGASGAITVNGAKYDNEMLSTDLTDQQVADVLNYVRNSWGNKGEAVKPEEVAPQRKKKAE